MRVSLLSAALLASGLTSAATPIDGWYASAFGGYTYIPSHVDVLFLNQFLHNTSFTGGYNVGGRIGYQSHPLRYEAEYTYLQARARFFKVADTDQSQVTGYSLANAVMANIYYDTPEMLPAVAPYLGFGIGYAYMQDRLNSTGPLLPVSFQANNSSFAYQGTVGLSFNFSENYAINLAYRYLTTTSTNYLVNRFQAHMASGGVVYHFDQGDYK